MYYGNRQNDDKENLPPTIVNPVSTLSLDDDSDDDDFFDDFFDS